jgi:hypothetical protein
MTSLHLERVYVTHAGSRLQGVDVSVEGGSLVLVGHWPALLAALSGRAQLAAGTVRIDGVDARAEVIAGRIGVADPELPPPPNTTLLDWLILNLRLFGLSANAAKEQAVATLQALHIDAYGGYVADRFPPSTLWIARVALALSTRPQCVVLPPPTWVAETMAMERAVVGIAQTLASVVLACDPAQHPELFFAADWAVLLEPSQGTVIRPKSFAEPGTRPYALVAITRRQALVERLQQAGVGVHNAQGEGELWVQLPPGAPTDVLVRAAVEAQAPLLRMTPLFEFRAGEYRPADVPSP